MFSNIATGRHIILRDIHQLASHTVAEGPAANPEGILVLRDESTLVIRLFNPLTRQLVDLPSVNTLLGDGDKLLDNKFKEDHMVTAAGFIGDSTVVLYFGAINKLAIAKPNDEIWVVVSHKELISTVTFGDHFYCLNSDSLMVLDAMRTPPQLVVVSPLIKREDRLLDSLHMVNSYDDLLVLWNECHVQPNWCWRILCVVCRVSFDMGFMVPLDNLGDRAIFTGPRGAVLLSVKDFPTFDANTIYFRYCCKSIYGKQCLFDPITKFYQPPKRSFGKSLISYITFVDDVNCDIGYEEEEEDDEDEEEEEG